MAHPRPSIVTSIAPGQRQDIQNAAVESWLDHGFRVLSLNAYEEIEELRSIYQGIEFVPKERTAKSVTGRPVIFISDILDYLRHADGTVFGIVNSDIYLPPHDGLMEQLSQLASGGLAFGPRLEVDRLTSSEGYLDPFGFDYFFFDCQILRLWPEQKFCLGMPFWDLWFPLVPIFAGTPTKKLISPIARHIPHKTQRDESFFMFNNEFAEAVLPQLDIFKGGLAAYRTLVNGADTQKGLEILAEYLDELTRYVIGYIDEKAEKIEIG
jgi:hypothetical protein